MTRLERRKRLLDFLAKGQESYKTAPAAAIATVDTEGRCGGLERRRELVIGAIRWQCEDVLRCAIFWPTVLGDKRRNVQKMAVKHYVRMVIEKWAGSKRPTVVGDVCREKLESLLIQLDQDDVLIYYVLKRCAYYGLAVRTAVCDAYLEGLKNGGSEIRMLRFISSASRRGAGRLIGDLAQYMSQMEWIKLCKRLPTTAVAWLEIIERSTTANNSSLTDLVVPILTNRDPYAIMQWARTIVELDRSVWRLKECVERNPRGFLRALSGLDINAAMEYIWIWDSATFYNKLSDRLLIEYLDHAPTARWANVLKHSRKKSHRILANDRFLSAINNDLVNPIEVLWSLDFRLPLTLMKSISDKVNRSHFRYCSRQDMLDLIEEFTTWIDNPATRDPDSDFQDKWPVFVTNAPYYQDLTSDYVKLVKKILTLSVGDMWLSRLQPETFFNHIRKAPLYFYSDQDLIQLIQLAITDEPNYSGLFGPLKRFYPSRGTVVIQAMRLTLKDDTANDKLSYLYPFFNEHPKDKTLLQDTIDLFTQINWPDESKDEKLKDEDKTDGEEAAAEESTPSIKSGDTAADETDADRAGVASATSPSSAEGGTEGAERTADDAGEITAESAAEDVAEGTAESTANDDKEDARDEAAEDTADDGKDNAGQGSAESPEEDAAEGNTDDAGEVEPRRYAVPTFLKSGYEDLIWRMGCERDLDSVSRSEILQMAKSSLRLRIVRRMIANGIYHLGDSSCVTNWLMSEERQTILDYFKRSNLCEYFGSHDGSKYGVYIRRHWCESEKTALLSLLKVRMDAYGRKGETGVVQNLKKFMKCINRPPFESLGTARVSCLNNTEEDILNAFTIRSIDDVARLKKLTRRYPYAQGLGRRLIDAVSTWVRQAEGEELKQLAEKQSIWRLIGSDSPFEIVMEDEKEREQFCKQIGRVLCLASDDFFFAELPNTARNINNDSEEWALTLFQQILSMPDREEAKRKYILITKKNSLLRTEEQLFSDVYSKDPVVKECMDSWQLTSATALAIKGCMESPSSDDAVNKKFKSFLHDKEKDDELFRYALSEAAASESPGWLLKIRSQNIANLYPEMFDSYFLEYGSIFALTHLSQYAYNPVAHHLLRAYAVKKEDE